MPHVDKRKSEKRPTLQSDPVGDDDDDATTDDATFFNVNIDSLLGKLTTFEFDPQTSKIQPMTWNFKRQSSCPANVTAGSTAVPKQVPETSTVEWNFRPQTKSEGSYDGWKFQKASGTNGDVQWQFDDQCPKSSTVNWEFPSSMASEGEIPWNFRDQIDGITPPAWYFNRMSSDQSTVSWTFRSQMPRDASTIHWDFGPQTPAKKAGKWKFKRQTASDSNIPWTFDSQLAGTAAPNWGFASQLSTDRHVNWGFTSQSGTESNVPWRFQQCLEKGIHDSQLAWGFTQCLAPTDRPVQWSFAPQMTNVKPVNWDNLPRLTESLDAGMSHTYDEICNENATFKEHYSRGYRDHKVSTTTAKARPAQQRKSTKT